MEEGEFREERNDTKEGQDERLGSKRRKREESQKEEHQKIKEKENQNLYRTTGVRQKGGVKSEGRRQSWVLDKGTKLLKRS